MGNLGILEGDRFATPTPVMAGCGEEGGGGVVTVLSGEADCCDGTCSRGFLPAEALLFEVMICCSKGLTRSTPSLPECDELSWEGTAARGFAMSEREVLLPSGSSGRLTETGCAASFRRRI